MIFRRPRLKKPGPLPHPIRDGFSEAFYSGIGIGFICAFALAVIVVKAQ